MLRDGACETKPDDRAATPRWQTVHRALVGIAKQRAGLDAEEARWLREAERVEIWKPVGMVSMVDYLERVCGYEPRSAQHRMRVARALENLPQLDEALASGALSFSAVRALVRVVTPQTEGLWREAAKNKNLREVEELVAGHSPGSTPTDPVEESARLHEIVFHEVSAASYALLRQARGVLDDEHGSRLCDSDVVAALANSILDGRVPRAADAANDATPAPDAGAGKGRAKAQISFIMCRCCERAWQLGRGARIPISSAAREQALCDAQFIGDLDSDTPSRATQPIPPAMVRLVWARDQGRCQTPGCRSARGLELHHIVHRANGGSNEASNLTLLCGSCHTAHHEGRLRIEGTAPDALVVHRPPLPVEEPPIVPDLSRVPATGAVPPLSIEYALVARRMEVVTTLRLMGLSLAAAKDAVDAALLTVDPGEPVEVLLRAALRLCPPPSKVYPPTKT